MKKLIEQRSLVRHNLFGIIAFCLLCYFTYHTVFGDRSFIRLMTLERSVTTVSQQYAALHNERQQLESRVVRLRPDSIDPDLLEERARAVLGYSRPDEKIIIQTH